MAPVHHITLTVRDAEEVRPWPARLDDLGMVHGPLQEAPYGWAVTARDPDNIPVEFFCPT